MTGALESARSTPRFRPRRQPGSERRSPSLSALLESPIAPTVRAEPVHDERCLGEIDRRHGLTPEEFRREYQRPRRPVILSGLTDDWPALREWSFASLRARVGAIEVPIRRCFGEKRLMPLAEYVDRRHELRGDGSKPPFYLEGWFYRDEAPELAADYSVPPHFAGDLHEKRWHPFRPKPLPHALILGAKGAFAKLHFDLGATHSWNAQIVGRKRWVLVSPDQMENCYPETRQVGGYFPGTDVLAPDLARYPRLAKLRYTIGVVHPGELIWFPSMHLHEVLSLDDTISITHNYVHPDILLRSLRALFLARVLKREGI